MGIRLIFKIFIFSKFSVFGIVIYCKDASTEVLLLRGTSVNFGSTASDITLFIDRIVGVLGVLAILGFLKN